jgi:hypothetical protein
MRLLWSCTVLAVLSFALPACAHAPAPARPKTYQVPYRLTVPKHLLVRAKINGKGPFNFILDTGAPALFVATELCEKLGIEPDRNGWGVFDRFEIEGGVVLQKFKGRIETPFQLKGMNGMGLAGAELHGIIGYNVLARYRMEIDFTRAKLTWTELDFEPPAPRGLGGRAGSAGGLEFIGSLMEMMGGFLGKKAAPNSLPRGFLGIELKDAADGPIVGTILADGPAGKAGVKTGDRISHVQGRTVVDAEDVYRFAGKIQAGVFITLTVVRDGKPVEIRFKTGEGL